MDPKKEDVMNYAIRSVLNTGFSAEYTKPIIEQVTSGNQLRLDLRESTIEKEKSVTIVTPVVEARAEAPDFYNYKGFEALHIKEGKEPIAHFFSVFRMRGANLDQAEAIFNGATVLVPDYDSRKSITNEADRYTANYERLATGFQRDNPTDNVPTIKVPVKSVDILALMSVMHIIADADKKKDLIAKLQTNGSVELRAAKSFEDRANSQIVTYHLNLQDEKTMQLNVVDREGMLVATKSVEVKLPVQAQKEVVNFGKSQKELPSFAQQALSEYRKSQAGGTNQSSSTAQVTPEPKGKKDNNEDSNLKPGGKDDPKQKTQKNGAKLKV